MNKQGILAPLTSVSGIGQKTAAALAAKGFNTLADLLFLMPTKYEDRTHLTPVDALRLHQPALLLLTVAWAKVQYGKKRTLLVQCHDQTGVLMLRLFQFSDYLLKALTPNRRLLVYGQANENYQGGWVLLQPEIQILPDQKPPTLPEKLTAVYPTTAGVGSKRLARLIQTALSVLADSDLADFDADFLAKQQMLPLKQALFMLHQPTASQRQADLLAEDSPALRRLVFDEFLSRQLQLQKHRYHEQAEPAVAFVLDQAKQAALLAQFGFTLTNAQQRVITEIFSDLTRDKPMHRLLQGDVGAGKTAVALAALLQAAANGLQAAFIAPTEVLAEQHFLGAKKYLEPLGVSVVWLAGAMSQKARQQALAAIADGSAAVVVGTHALFQEAVQYAKLGLVVVDEQHRFGVLQRKKMRDKSAQLGFLPHMLVMSATPIPRTLAMSFYADLDTSILDEMPPNRQGVTTVILAENKRDSLFSRLSHVLEKGQQAYWVCALIETSEVLQATAASALFETISAALPHVRIALLHGRQKAEEKAAIMRQFAANEVQLLVSTTVIEVGVDVKNATVMVIENAERFGLSQLHQLRGRVGRGGDAAFCVLLYTPPLSKTAMRRLEIMRESQDGFYIAEEDLRLRGAGELLGTRQAGDMQLRIGDIVRDADLLQLANAMAADILQQEPAYAEAIIQRWAEEADLLTV